MERKDIIGLSVIGVLVLATIFGFLPGEASTHVCIPEIGDYLDMDCDRLSSTSLTCYPNVDDRKGSRYCGSGWKAIDRSDLIDSSEIIQSGYREVCNKYGCSAI